MHGHPEFVIGVQSAKTAVNSNQSDSETEPDSDDEICPSQVLSLFLLFLDAYSTGSDGRIAS